MVLRRVNSRAAGSASGRICGPEGERSGVLAVRIRSRAFSANNTVSGDCGRRIRTREDARSTASTSSRCSNPVPVFLSRATRRATGIGWPVRILQVAALELREGDRLAWVRIRSRVRTLVILLECPSLAGRYSSAPSIFFPPSHFALTSLLEYYTLRCSSSPQLRPTEAYWCRSPPVPNPQTATYSAPAPF